MSRGSDDPVQLKSIQIGDVKFHIVSLQSQAIGQTQIAANLNITGGGGYAQGNERQYSYLVIVETEGKALPYDIWHSFQQRIMDATGIAAEKVEIIPKE